jgi:uncharacterized OB-fold protein
VAVIDLDEGPRIISNVIDLPIAEVTCDVAVRVVYAEQRDGYLIPKFVPR